jgi:hypothetical protein
MSAGRSSCLLVATITLLLISVVGCQQDKQPTNRHHDWVSSDRFGKPGQRDLMLALPSGFDPIEACILQTDIHLPNGDTYSICSTHYEVDYNPSRTPSVIIYIWDGWVIIHGEDSVVQTMEVATGDQGNQGAVTAVPVTQPAKKKFKGGVDMFVGISPDTGHVAIYYENQATGNIGSISFKFTQDGSTFWVNKDTLEEAWWYNGGHNRDSTLAKPDVKHLDHAKLKQLLHGL